MILLIPLIHNTDHFPNRNPDPFLKICNYRHGENGTPVHYWWGCRLVESSMELPQKIKNRTALWPSDSTVWNISKETRNRKNICIPTFIAALFTIANIWKQPECPSGHTWIQKLCQVAQLLGRCPVHQKLAGLIPHWGVWGVQAINGRQPINVSLSPPHSQASSLPLINQ